MKKYGKKVSVLIPVFLVLSIVFSGCSSIGKNESYTTRDLNEQLVMATLWMQTSAEYRALCYQTFNIARFRLDSFLDSYNGNKPVAIIVDADETVIDNTAYDAFLVGNDFGFSSETWNAWMEAGIAPAVPGATDFLQYADSRGVETFYVTNRRMVGYEGTRKNLDALGFPNVDEKHLLLRTDDRDKQPRRDIVLQDYEVALYLGDNLHDFESVFGGSQSVEERFAETDSIRDAWGSKYIVLPNPMYGYWENALIKESRPSTAEEVDRLRKDNLSRWNYQP